MLQIAQHILDAAGQGKDLVLVTVVRRVGSTPRGIGSQMLVSSEGLECGTIGGGMVELRAINQAKELLTSGESLIEDLSLNYSKAQGLNMPCGGDTTLLHSFIGSDDIAWTNVMRAVQEHLDNQNPASLMIQRPKGKTEAIKEGIALLHESGRCVAGNGSLIPDDFTPPQTPKLDEKLFAMPLPLPHRAVVFGAGHVARALVPMLSSVDFSCTVYDCRPEFATQQRFPDARHIICEPYENASEALPIGPRDYVIIMTHGHETDYQILEQVLRQPCAYIGFMGSRKKIAAARARALEAGFSEESLNSIHWPIGLSIKAETPAEIAISVVSECVLHRASQQ